MNDAATAQAIARHWDSEIISLLQDYIRIPAKSPHFDRNWEANGHIEDAVRLAERWARRQPIAGIKVDIVRLPRRTPVLLIEMPSTASRLQKGTVLLYGHLDKQPEMTGWRDGFGPWDPLIESDRLYGRGGADDGYAVFAALSAIAALQSNSVAHARCVALIETCEESGSYDLPPYLDALASRMGPVDLVIGLDSGCGDYERLWMTTSLRGIAAGTLHVTVLTEGVHSGDASGIVPSSFRIVRKLLDRLEDATTGEILPAAFHAKIPEERKQQAVAAAQILGDELLRKYPFAGGTQPIVGDHVQAVLNRTWTPALSVIGAGGLPSIADAGNVLRPRTSLKLSLRLPPTINGAKASAALQRLLESQPPHGAIVEFEPDQGTTGWNAPATAPWLWQALDRASQAHYGKPAAAMGEGVTIPFIGMLGKHFPQAQFLITGVLGPHSNAHGPNEFLHLGYAKKLTACVANAIAAYTVAAGEGYTPAYR